MRLGTQSSNEFMKEFNEKNKIIEELFRKKIENLTKTIPTKVMLGDGTVTEQETFDPNQVQNFFEKFVRNLDEWEVQQISVANNEDLRRIFVKFKVREGNYQISGHFSIQFHVLLYYKPDNRVIECQKELSKLIDRTKNTETLLAEQGDQIVMNKLKEMGYKDMDYQNMFEIFFENDQLREKIYSEVTGQKDDDLKDLLKRKTDLFNELDSFLVETYQTTSVLIDETRLVSGEEGCLCTLDMEFIKNKTNEGIFDPRRMSKTIRLSISRRLDQVTKILQGL